MHSLRPRNASANAIGFGAASSTSRSKWQLLRPGGTRIRPFSIVSTSWGRTPRDQADSGSKEHLRKTAFGQHQVAPGSIASVATCGYSKRMISTGIRELKNNLSHYVRQIETGKRIAVTANGRVVAELVPPSRSGSTAGNSRYDELVAAGIIEPAVEPNALVPRWPDIHLPPGTAVQLIDSDRDES